MRPVADGATLMDWNQALIAHPTRRALVFGLPLLLTAPAIGAKFVDPMDMPARPSPLASRNLLLAVAQVGARLVAVGQRGHIVYSDDQGASWKQGSVPVSSDLTAVSFPSASKGWAVGHDGVILHSGDRGLTWVKQLDGSAAVGAMVADLEKKLAVVPGNKDLQALLSEATRYREAGPDKPFLDVWFADEKTGYAVGAYNLLFHTSDGGEHWESWFDRTENPKLSHLNAIRGAGDQVYVVGERGLVLKLDKTTGRFVARPMTYAGSFFALAPTATSLTVFGMRGSAYRTSDDGRSWTRIEIGVQAGFSGATVLSDGRILAVSQAGEVLLSKDDGASYAIVKGVQPMAFAAVSPAGKNSIALTGTQGVRVERLP
jgi:photosystem II stability/assembly factor-like uncharacterized protein